jgi:hypothetical protein
MIERRRSEYRSRADTPLTLAAVFLGSKAFEALSRGDYGEATIEGGLASASLLMAWDAYRSNQREAQEVFKQNQPEKNDDLS